MPACLRSRRATADARPWIVSLYACHVALLAWMAWSWMGTVGSLPHAKGSVLVDVWLLGVLGIAATAWVVLAVRRRVAPDTGAGLLLAGFGLLSRVYCDLVVYGAAALLVVDGRSRLETHPDAQLRFLLDAHRYGGLAAFAIGAALTAWASTVDLRRGYRG